MCSNYLIAATQQELADEYGVYVFGHIERTELHPQHQAPTILRLSNGERRLQEMRWGLLPHWAMTAEDPPQPCQAKAEGIDVSPFFRGAFKHRRCLIPATAFYDWREESRKRVRYRLSLPGHSHFAFAGLWNLWRDDLYTCTLIVAEASSSYRPFHHLQPVTLTAKQYADWLDPRSKPADLKTLLHAWPCELLETPEPASAKVASGL